MITHNHTMIIQNQHMIIHVQLLVLFFKLTSLTFTLIFTWSCILYVFLKNIFLIDFWIINLLLSQISNLIETSVLFTRNHDPCLIVFAMIRLFPLLCVLQPMDYLHTPLPYPTAVFFHWTKWHTCYSQRLRNMMF